MVIGQIRGIVSYQICSRTVDTSTKDIIMSDAGPIIGYRQDDAIAIWSREPPYSDSVDHLFLSSQLVQLGKFFCQWHPPAISPFVSGCIIGLSSRNNHVSISYILIIVMTQYVGSGIIGPYIRPTQIGRLGSPHVVACPFLSISVDFLFTLL